MKYTEDSHLLPLKKLANNVNFQGKELTIENQDDFIKSFLKYFFEETYDIPSPYSGFSRKLYYHVLSKEKLKNCPESLIGQWAYFPDVEMQVGFQESFGQIVALRNTHSWEGYKYFIKRPNQNTCMEISNATLCAFDLDIPDMDSTIKDDKLQNIFNSLNMFGEFNVEDEWIKGKLVSFNDEENVFTIIDLESNERHDISCDHFKHKSKNLKDNARELLFSMTTIVKE